MSWLGIDSGAKRSGLAISWSGQLAEPFGLSTGELDDQIIQIAKLVAKQSVDVIIVGLPSSAGDDHPARQMLARLTTYFANHVPPIRIETIDETLSTKEAERFLRARKADVQSSDALAACLILEQYFNEYPPTL